MMDNMKVPEQVYFVAPAVYPVAVKVNDDKSEYIYQQGVLNAGDGHMLQHEGIDADGNGKTEYILGNIGNAAAEGGYHVHIADGILSFVPAPPFFKKYQRQEGRHGNQQYLAVGFHFNKFKYNPQRHKERNGKL